MEITIFSSGSQGNATLIQTEETLILLDCGISFKKLKTFFIEQSLNINDLTHVFITHEHGDHSRGLYQLIKQCNPKIVTSQGTYDILAKKQIIKKKYIISHSEKVKINNVYITALQTSHDSKESLFYIFETTEDKFWFFHDSGYMPQKYYKYLENPTLLVIESNYDTNLLLNSTKYPYNTKMRINSDVGHLSNDQAYKYIMDLFGIKTKEIILAHISENNNNFNILNIMYKEFIEKSNIKVTYTHQKTKLEKRVLYEE